MAGCDAPDRLPGPQEIKSDLVPHSYAQYEGIGEGRVRLRLTSWACDPCTQKGPAFEVECFAVAAAVFSIRSDETGAYVLGAKRLGSYVLISQPRLWFVSKPGPLLLPLLDLPTQTR